MPWEFEPPLAYRSPSHELLHTTTRFTPDAGAFGTEVRYKVRAGNTEHPQKVPGDPAAVATCSEGQSSSLCSGSVVKNSQKAILQDLRCLRFKRFPFDFTNTSG